MDKENKRLKEPQSAPVKTDAETSSGLVAKDKLREDAQQNRFDDRGKLHQTEESPGSGHVRSESSERSHPIGEWNHGVSKDHWGARGGEANRFHVTKDQHERTTVIEGWLGLRKGERPDADAAIQGAFRKEHGLDETQHAFHLIAHQHGAPSTADHHPEKVKENLVSGDGLINQSYHAKFENQISKYLAEGKELYCKATISYANDGSKTLTPERITYAYYIRNKEGKPEEFEIKEYQVRVDSTPGGKPGPDNQRLTANKALKQADAEDFYDRRWKGQHPELPN